MKYTILSLNRPERNLHRTRLVEAMEGHQRITVECVDGSNEQQLHEHIDRYGFKINFDAWRPGEAGVWYSNINAWKACADLGENLLVFEDDATLDRDFLTALSNLTLPSDFDFISLYTPYRNQFQQSAFQVKKETKQEHGMVCMLYSPGGATRILKLLQRDGLTWPVDIWLFKQDFERGELVGYYPRPISKVIVQHDFSIPTTVHSTERIDVYHGKAK